MHLLLHFTETMLQYMANK